MVRSLPGLAVALAALLAGCAPKEEVLEEVKGPVHARLLRHTRYANGPIPLEVTSCTLELATDPPFSQAVPCDRPQKLEEDATGAVIAFKVGKAEWYAARTSAHAVVIDCAPGLGDGRHPEFAKLTRVPEGVAACGPEMQVDLAASMTGVHDVSDPGDPASAAELISRLARTMPDPWRPDSNDEEDPWVALAWGAPEAVQALARPKVCRALTDAKAPFVLYLRAARFCEANTEEIGDAALARLEAAFQAWPAPVDGQPDRPALLWALTIAAHLRPEQTGARGCEYLARRPAFDRTRTGFALGAVAASRAPCPAIEPMLGPWLSCESLQCGDARCAPSDADRAVREWLELGRWAHGPRAGPDPTPKLPNVSLLALAASPTVELRARRCAYPVTEPGKPDCRFTQGNPGQPCNCGLGPGRYFAAWLPLDGGWMTTPMDVCEIRADDKAKKVGFTRRICRGADAGCSNDPALCCAGLRCAVPGPDFRYACVPDGQAPAAAHPSP